MSVLFCVFAAIAILGAASAMALRSAVHAVLALALAFVGLAILYLELAAQFVGFTQVIVYVGAVAILAVFAIMMTRGDSAHLHLPVFSRSWIAGLAIAGGVFAVLAWAILGGGGAHQMAASTPAPPSTVVSIGQALMQRDSLALELMGLLLTAALIGAVVLAMPIASGASSAKEEAE